MKPTERRLAHPDTLRRAAGGELIGSQEPDGTHAWRGIRYAASPTGPRTLEPGPDTLVLDTPAGGGVHMAAIRQGIVALKNALHDSDQIASGTARCRIYARVFLWVPLFTGHGSESEYAEWCQQFGCRESASAFRPAVEV